ncbi:MAG: hypothetical protein ABIC68_08015 [Candidatus Omnitrophota bacterium]
MKKIVFYLMLLLLCQPVVLAAAEGVVGQQYSVQLPDIATMVKSRFAQDEQFKSFVELMLIVGAGNLLLGTFLTAVIGLRQPVLWFFIGGYLLTGVLEFLLLLYRRFSLGGYSCLLACFIGLICAFFAYRYQLRYCGYGHARFHG